MRDPIEEVSSVDPHLVDVLVQTPKEESQLPLPNDGSVEVEPGQVVDVLEENDTRACWNGQQLAGVDANPNRCTVPTQLGDQWLRCCPMRPVQTDDDAAFTHRQNRADLPAPEG